ncbi:MAG: polysaccharide deacetylase, partial [Alphaproteobacteria bacterium]|nr:polysaccharide deacetylase [Alphaproteobacteria bacterium]
VAASQWEVAAAGVDMGKLHHGGLGEDEERGLVTRAAKELRAALRSPVRGWHSPAHSQSRHTLDLVAEAGLDWVADWINDDMPYSVATRSGGALTAMPLAWDLSDQRLLFQQHMDTSEFVEQVLRAFKTLYAEAASKGGRVLTLTLTPWLMGQPHRIRALGALLDRLLEPAGVWPATGSAIVDAWRTK